MRGDLSIPALAEQLSPWVWTTFEGCFLDICGDRVSINTVLFWLKDDSLQDIDSLPAPNIIAVEIVENLKEALEQFTAVAEALEKSTL